VRGTKTIECRWHGGIAKPVDDPFIAAQEIGVRLQEFAIRDFRAARPGWAKP
jgi:hypothetical protein